MLVKENNTSLITESKAMENNGLCEEAFSITIKDVGKAHVYIQ